MRKYKNIEYGIGIEPRSDRECTNSESYTINIPELKYFKMIPRKIEKNGKKKDVSLVEVEHFAEEKIKELLLIKK